VRLAEFRTDQRKIGFDFVAAVLVDHDLFRATTKYRHLSLQYPSFEWSLPRRVSLIFNKENFQARFLSGISTTNEDDFDFAKF
jgi:hypothetical protein